MRQVYVVIRQLPGSAPVVHDVFEVPEGRVTEKLTRLAHQSCERLKNQFPEFRRADFHISLEDVND